MKKSETHLKKKSTKTSKLVKTVIQLAKGLSARSSSKYSSFWPILGKRKVSLIKLLIELKKHPTKVNQLYKAANLISTLDKLFIVRSDMIIHQNFRKFSSI